jgi:hypothetical protein
MDVEDDGLRRKILNVVVDGRPVGVAYDEKYASVSIWYNDSGSEINCIDFWGESDQDTLKQLRLAYVAAYRSTIFRKVI